VPSTAGSASDGTGYAFDVNLTVSPFGTDFRFPWQTGDVYGST
jgi:hypothetical protein